MKMNKIFSINTILRLAAGAILAAALFGCANMGESPASSAGVTGGAGVGGGAGAGSGSATVSGSLCFSGAMPSEIAALVAPVSLSGATRQSFDNTSRSAFPGTPALSGLTYTVYAQEILPDGSTETPLRYDGTVAEDGKSYTVGIPVTEGKKYYVYASAANSDGFVLLSGKSAVLDFTTITSFKTDVNIALGAVQTAAGKGLVSLEVNVDCAEIDHARVWYTPTGADSPRFLPATKSGSTYTFNIGYLHEGDFVDAVQSGAYTMTFDFLPEDNSRILYSFKETVNVFDGMTTNKWVKNGAEPWLTPDSSGNIACKITDAMVTGFTLTDIYVDTSRQTANPNAEDGSYTTESGTFLNPKRSFTDALAMLQDASKGYTIFIKGTIGPQTIPDTLKNSGTGSGNTYAKSLTLCGVRDPEDGVPTDSIDASGAAGTSALTIATTVPVTIKNLMITGGTGTIKVVSTLDGMFTTSNSCGGGIYLSAAGGSLTLGKGAYVSENCADHSSGSGTMLGYGGGVFISAPGELNLLDGSVVSNNGAETQGYGGGIAIYDIDATGASCKLNIYDGALIEKNQATLNGGGIFLGKLPVDVAMSGGRISGNVSGVSGGAIYGSSGTFTMTGGVIGDDSDSITLAAKYGDSTRTSAKSNKTGGNGGAFCFANTSGGSDEFNINLYGGTVAYNCAQDFGGAFSLQGGNLTVKGAEIKWNGASGESSAKGGGAVYLTSCAKLYLDGCTIAGNECYGSSEGGAICMIGNSDTTRTPKTFLKGAVSIPSDGPKNNDIWLESFDDSATYMAYPSLYIEGKLTGSEPVATITPSLYSSDRQVLALADGVTDTSVPEEAGKFEVTPQVDGGVTKNWIVASTGMLAKVVRVPAVFAAAAIPSLENGDILQITGGITGTRSSGLAGDILTALQASDASVKITLDLSKCTNTTMANNCFEYCSCIDNVILPPNLTEVPDSMFSECHLTSVTFPSALESIGSAAFNKCDFTSITIPDTVKTVGDQAFANNASLTTVSMSNSVTSLGEGCFANCSELTSVTFSNNITELPAEVFLNCSRLRMYSVPGNVTTLGDRAFCGTGCTNFEVNTKVTSLGAELFKNTSIQRVTVLGNFTWYCNGEVVNANFAVDNAEKLKVNEYPWTRG